MSEMSEIRQVVEDKLTGIHAEIKAGYDASDMQFKHVKKELESIQRKQDITNGRVKDLEKQTKMSRYLEKHPVIFVFILFGFSIAINVIEPQQIINALIRFLS